MEHYYAMILAGGGGTRMWPLSRKTMPKQLLALTGDQSMLRISVERLSPLFPPENVYVVTGRQLEDAIRAELPEIPAQNIIIEPYGRDNAAATGLGLSVIHKRDRQATVAILTADHHIAKREKFREVLRHAYRMAQNDRVITLGISPTYPATSFGYIQQGRKIAGMDEFTVYESLGFKEKPNAVTATKFLASGNFTWNSGMFIWKTTKAMAEFQRQQPVMYGLLEQLGEAIDTPAYDAVLAEVWEKMPKISIDYAIMEGAENLAVIPVDIGWSDVGSWSSLFEVLPLDQYGNSFKGIKGGNPDPIILDTRDTLVLSDRLTVTIGVEDLIIIDSDDALLICHKDRAQDVREVVNHLRASGQDNYL
ncbi:MAG TPA: sugar phosphate nucleotidyltransferase [Aggregatilineales bacterium]|jgi:mannose-1-phosphate guanylyltransferase|nr:sugar phosphate nucleotidyltransferase [Aggregatilineales bacterium]